jgi:hypothetical protein
MRLWIVVLCVFVATSVVGYRYMYPSISYRVRLSVVVDHEGKTSVGSSVIQIGELTFATFGGILDGGVEFSSQGEAVFVDLGNSNNLVALLGLMGMAHDDIVRIAQETFFPYNFRSRPENRNLASAHKKLASEFGKPMKLDVAEMPTLARFRNLNDPKTIESVDPAHMEATYGPDFHLREVTIELTNDPVTSGLIEKRLPWLHRKIGDTPFDPRSKHTIYRFDLPELKQDPIFFEGFVRK